MLWNYFEFVAYKLRKYFQENNPGFLVSKTVQIISKIVLSLKI